MYIRTSHPISLTNMRKPSISNLSLNDWPPPNTQHHDLFLSPSGLATTSSTEEHIQTYQSDFRARQDSTDSQELHFSHTFSKRSYLLGYSSVTLYVSCLESDDLDIFVQIGKADTQGNLVQSQNIPQAALDKQGLSKEKIPPISILRYLGPMGQVRASARHTVANSVSGDELKAGKIRAGEIVKLDIKLGATGMLFEKDERLVLKVSGHPMNLAESPALWGAYRPANKGLHRVHFGGRFKSCLRISLLDEGQVVEDGGEGLEKISSSL